MSRIKEAAATENVDWRTLVRLTQRTPRLSAATGNALMTSPDERSSTDRALIGMAREISAKEAERTDRVRNRQRGVNQLSGRVNGQWVEGGQPRGQREGRRGRGRRG